MSEAADLRAEATVKLAEHLYNSKATRLAPPWEEAPPMIRHALLEGATEVVSLIWEVGRPIAPDVEVLRMRIQMLATEVGEQRKVGGREMREALLDLLAEESV